MSVINSVKSFIRNTFSNSFPTKTTYLNLIEKVNMPASDGFEEIVAYCYEQKRPGAFKDVFGLFTNEFDLLNLKDKEITKFIHRPSFKKIYEKGYRNMLVSDSGDLRIDSFFLSKEDGYFKSYVFGFPCNEIIGHIYFKEINWRWVIFKKKNEK
jgi:hypothetical protein